MNEELSRRLDPLPGSLRALYFQLVEHGDWKQIESIRSGNKLVKAGLATRGAQIRCGATVTVFKAVPPLMVGQPPDPLENWDDSALY
jgi:hypothetical protein